MLGCSSVEPDKFRREPVLKKLKQVFKNYVSRSEKRLLVPESAIDTSNFPLRSGRSMQGCEYVLKQSSSLGCSNQRLRLRLRRSKAGHGVVLAITKTPLLKKSSGREGCLKFSKRRSGSFGGNKIQRGT